MIIKHLKLDNFKNHLHLELEFSSHLTFIVGKNGVGKTNILDSIFYLCTTKSFISHLDNNSIGYEKINTNLKYRKPYFFLEGHFDNDGTENRVRLLFDGKKKSIKVNEDLIKKIKDYVGTHSIICISPDDIDTIKGTSDLRRKLFDRIICQVDSDYLDKLSIYNKLLKERNKLIKSEFLDHELLNTYNDKLIELSNMIYKVRRNFIDHYSEYFLKSITLITNHDLDDSSLEYSSRVSNPEFAKEFYSSTKKDIAIGYTTMGIHKDDYIFKIQNQPLKVVASQGQKKSFIISLKLAFANMLLDKYQMKPIILMDDIFEKLDNKREENIIMYIHDNPFFQFFITDTSINKKKLFENHNLDYSIVSLN